MAGLDGGDIRALAQSELKPEVTPWFPPEHGSSSIGAGVGGVGVGGGGGGALASNYVGGNDGTLYYDTMWGGQGDYYVGSRRIRGRGAAGMGGVVGGRRIGRAARGLDRGGGGGGLMAGDERLGRGGRGGGIRVARNGSLLRGMEDEEDGDAGRAVGRGDKSGRMRGRGRGARGDEWGMMDDWGGGGGRLQQPSSTSRTAEFEEAYQKNLKLLSGANLGGSGSSSGSGGGGGGGGGGPPSQNPRKLDASSSSSSGMWTGADPGLGPATSAADKAASRSAREAKREEERERDRLEREARDREEALRDEDIDPPYFDAAIHNRADPSYLVSSRDAMALYLEKRRQEEIERELCVV